MKVIEFGKGNPQITIIGGIHGDEPSGPRIIYLLEEYLSKQTLNGSVKLIIANEKALTKNVRYIEKDVNRIFPGNINSEIYEEQLAAKIFNEIQDSSFVLALHSTKSSPPPFAIYSKLTNINKKSIKNMHIEYAVDCGELTGNTLDSHFDNAVTLECGKQHSEEAINLGFKACKNILRAYNILTDKNSKEHNVKIFKAEKEIHKGCGEPQLYYNNFENIQKGTILAEDNEYTHRINEPGFVPILASKNGYENIYGLLGKFDNEI